MMLQSHELILPQRQGLWKNQVKGANLIGEGSKIGIGNIVSFYMTSLWLIHESKMQFHGNVGRIKMHFVCQQYKNPVMHEKNGIPEVEKVLKTATVSKLYIS